MINQNEFYKGIEIGQEIFIGKMKDGVICGNNMNDAVMKGVVLDIEHYGPIKREENECEYVQNYACVKMKNLKTGELFFGEWNNCFVLTDEDIIISDYEHGINKVWMNC